jgi:hypothetical protein
MSTLNSYGALCFETLDPKPKTTCLDVQVATKTHGRAHKFKQSMTYLCMHMPLQSKVKGTQ